MALAAFRKPLNLIVSDIEGCLSPGKGFPLDLRTLADIQQYNVQTKETGGIPLTLCTGRSQPFVEAFCQALAVRLPCVCENGSFLYDMEKDRLIRHPGITEEHVKSLHELQRFLELEVRKIHPHHKDSSKLICISLNPELPEENNRETVLSLYEHIKPFVSPDLFNITHSASAVDITPKGIDKAAGVRFLSEVLKMPVERMLGIGDSEGDLSFLRIVGAAAAPSNCADAVRKVVHYTSDRPEARGVADIIGRAAKAGI